MENNERKVDSVKAHIGRVRRQRILLLTHLIEHYKEHRVAKSVIIDKLQHILDELVHREFEVDNGGNDKDRENVEPLEPDDALDKWLEDQLAKGH